MLDEVDISKREFDVFCRSVREFHPTTFIYAINNPPLQDELLQHTRFVSLTIQNAPSKVFFRCWEVEDINCSDQDLCQPEVEFLSLQPVTSDDMSEEVSKEAVMAMKSMQSFTESKFFGTTWDFKKFQVPLDQSFITCSTSCEWFYALFTATQKKSRFFHVLRKIWPHSMCL